MERGTGEGVGALDDLSREDGQEKATVIQTNVGSVSKATLGKRLRHEVKRVWAFQSA